jgi:hypothetical protein
MFSNGVDRSGKDNLEPFRRTIRRRIRRSFLKLTNRPMNDRLIGPTASGSLVVDRTEFWVRHDFACRNDPDLTPFS